MQTRILQVLTLIFSVTLAGSYVYLSSQRPLARDISPKPNDGPTSAPVFTRDLDQVIPGTKSFVLLPTSSHSPQKSQLPNQASTPTAEPKSDRMIMGTKSAPIHLQSLRQRVVDEENRAQSVQWIPYKPIESSEAADKRIIDVLTKRGVVAIDRKPLANVLLEFAKKYDIAIELSEKSLEEAGISPNENISLEVSELSLRNALKLILQPRGLTYVVEKGVLRITTVR